VRLCRWKLCVFVLLLSPTFGQKGRQPAAILGDPVKSYSLTASNLAEALTKAAQRFHIPVGIEWITAPDVPRKWSWQKSTVGAILADVVKAYPEYALTVAGGPVRVSPVALQKDPGDIINHRVPSFAIDRATFISAVIELECQLNPIVHSHFPGEPTLACSGRPSAKGTLATMPLMSETAAERPMTFTMNDVPVGDILDRLLIQSRRYVWLVTYPPQDIRTDAGFLITMAANGLPKDDWRLVPFFDFPGPRWTRLSTPEQYRAERK
jgi:hypothetical protein